MDDAQYKGNPNWLPGGPSPNPKGRPKRGKAFADHAREVLSAKELHLTLIMDDGKGNSKKQTISIKSEDGKSMYYAVAVRMLADSLQGNVRAAHELLDRADGRVPLAIREVPHDTPKEKKYIKVGGRYIEF